MFFSWVVLMHQTWLPAVDSPDLPKRQSLPHGHRNSPLWRLGAQGNHTERTRLGSRETSKEQHQESETCIPQPLEICLYHVLCFLQLFATGGSLSGRVKIAGVTSWALWVSRFGPTAAP